MFKVTYRPESKMIPIKSTILILAAICLKESIARSMLVQKPICLCYKIYTPICGSDGVTYDNTCLLDCANRAVSAESCGANKITKAYSGRCRDETCIAQHHI